MPDETDSSGQFVESNESEADHQRRLNELTEKAAKLKSEQKDGKFGYSENADLRASKASSAGYRGLGFGLAAAYALIGPVIVGLGIGWLIDGKSGNTMGRVIGVCIGIVVGFGSFLFFATKGASKD